MSQVKGIQIPTFIIVFVGLVMFGDYYLRLPYVPNIAGFLTRAGVVITTIAMILGAVNVIRIHGGYLVRRARGQWPFSLALLSVMLIMFITGLVPPLATHPVHIWLFQWIWTRGYLALWCLPAFFIATAAFRAFRVRSWEGTVLLISGFIMMLYSAPFGSVLAPAITPVGDWFLQVPNMGSQRGITLAAAVGAIVFGIRIFLGRERLSSG